MSEGNLRLAEDIETVRRGVEHWSNTYNSDLMRAAFERVVKAANSHEALKEALVQARGALLLDAATDDDGEAYGTTMAALRAIEDALDAAGVTPADAALAKAEET